MTNTLNNKVLLIMPYLEKGLGVRYLANYLTHRGFEVTVVFFKELQSLFEEKIITEKELSLLSEIIKKENYLFVGLSIHSSLVINEIKNVINLLKKESQSPFIIGGVFASISPQECAKNCDIVMRGEGEIAITELANALKNGTDWEGIQNLAYYKNKIYMENELRPLEKNIDNISFPPICENIYLIENNGIKKENPQLTTEFYEISGSRGCPFNCSFCCSSNMRKIYRGKGEYLRFRSVDNVMEELHIALKKNKNIKVIRFWDEVFSNEKGWVKEFVQRYKKEIGLPFHAWGHPSMIKNDIIKMLKSAGLYRIVVGFQSGSPNIRNNIFNRPETNEQIINASKILSKNKIQEIFYDLMICHPLETLEELKETFYLCMKLEPPFIFEMHQLAYQPGAEILKEVIKRGICTEEELSSIFNKPFSEQNRNFLEPIKLSYINQPDKEVWANLIYLTQFTNIRKHLIKLAKDPYKNEEKIKTLKENYEIRIQDKSTQSKSILKGQKSESIISRKIKKVIKKFNKEN